MSELSPLPEGVDPIDWTTARQALASDPDRSAWVSANAGSGKTHVLTQRVIRLLLAGTRPSSILCLTYTKAAASEMSNRVFSRLADWATLDDEALADRIAQIEGMRPDRLKIVEARRLFAKALETPGGLKIQTIHAFCEALLHQFPLEANVAGHFSVLDDRTALTVLTEARRSLLTATSAEENTELAEAFSHVLSIADEFGLDALLNDIVSNRQVIRTFLREAARVGGTDPRLRQIFGFSETDSEDVIAQGIWPLNGMSGPALSAYIDLAEQTGGVTAKAIAEDLRKAVEETKPFIRIGYFESALLTKQGMAKSPKTLMTAAMLKVSPHLLDGLLEAQEHVLQCRDRLRLFRMYVATRSALVLAERLIEDYEELKKTRSQLDFEDLIARTAELLTKSDAGPWIHYKLDQGIDHILVDEAQDTSPIQWSVIRSLRDDFFSGQSARQLLRTFFAVGDEKQSIYSFQGARPERFAEESRLTEQEVLQSGALFDAIRLPLSFRSTMSVLSAVDQVFSIPDNARGLGDQAQTVVHMSSRIGHPGKVELWDMIAPAESAKDDDWTAPFDSTPESAPSAVLARRIAERIGAMVGQETIVDHGVERPIEAGDILVLVRKRDSFVTSLTRSLKRRGDIPVAGADRLKLAGHIAIQDLLALGRFVLVPSDDLSLAALFKSPLFDLSEDDLFDAAAHRPENTSLWSHLQTVMDAGPWSSVVPRLEKLLALGRHATVHEFYANVLGSLGGRRAFLARLGTEVSDILDEFLNFALSSETTGLPGLQNFISTLELESPVIKRELDKARNEVRIMTVHASKGLEAPVVFLVDGGTRPFNSAHLPKFRIMTVAQGDTPVPVWIPTKDLANSLTQADSARVEALAEEEYRRLLYVAMTRAADRLIVCGSQGKRPQGGIWHEMIAQSLRLKDDHCREVTFSGADGEWGGLIWEQPGHIRDFPQQVANQKAEQTETLPESLLRPLPEPKQLPRPLSPSGAGGLIESNTGDALIGSPLFGETESAGLALQKGRLVHRMLQVLPSYRQDEREEAAWRYLERAARFWPREERDKVHASIVAVLAHEGLQAVFSSKGQAEVSIMGTLELDGHPRAVSGRIDRLAVSDDRVILLDYKTNRVPPRDIQSVPLSHSAQLAIYQEILKPLFPGKAFECLLVYTENASLITLDDACLSHALAALKTV